MPTGMHCCLRHLQNHTTLKHVHGVPYAPLRLRHLQNHTTLKQLCQLVPTLPRLRHLQNHTTLKLRIHQH